MYINHDQIMKKFIFFIIALMSLMMTASCNNAPKMDTEVRKKLAQDEKYLLTKVKDKDVVDVHVKRGEKVFSITPLESSFYVTFVSEKEPEYHGKYFLDNPQTCLTDKGEMVNPPLRHYNIFLSDGEQAVEASLIEIKTSRRVLKIHYIYE